MATTPVSPKVKSAGAVGAIVALLVSYAGQVTPDTFDFLGVWKTPAFLLISLGAAIYAAYQTHDPLRVDPQAAVVAVAKSVAETNFDAVINPATDAAAAADPFQEAPNVIASQPAEPAAAPTADSGLDHPATGFAGA